MRRLIQVLSVVFLLSMILVICSTCKKEEYVIVYSKVSTVRVYNTTSTSVSVEGSIDSLTSAAHDEYGFCLDTLPNPTVYKQKLLASGIVQTGSFSGSITGLKPSKNYHVRAFIKDNKKYIYGSDLSFTTSDAIVPTVTTNSVTDIKANTASCGGDVSAEGDRPVLAKGVCYDTIAGPTINKNRSMDGWGPGSFTSYIKGLEPDKTYYLRAYAVSEFGIGYGSQQTFTTQKSLYTFHDDFSDNSNNWDTVDYDGGIAAIENGEYSISYNQEGYLWLMFNKFPDFKLIAPKDFEISTCLKISSYNPLLSLNLYCYGGLIWNADDTHFRYFLVRKTFQLDRSYKSKSYIYSYQIGEYDNGYTTWKDYTEFSGSDSTKLSIKKANSKYYFFIDDVQVYSCDYVSVNYDGVGFLIEDATVSADFLYIDQKDFKKSENTEMIEMKSLSGGHRIIRSFLKK